MSRPLHDVAVIGTGLWEGPAIGNAELGLEVDRKRAKDPYRGREDAAGTVRIAGMELATDRYARTIAAIRRAFDDPYRGTVRRRFFPRDLRVSEAEAAAARSALADAGIDAKDVDALLVQSFLPDEIQPKNAALIAHALGIRHALAWGVDTICNSVVSQMQAAAALIASGQARHVLCVVSAAYSRVADPGASSTVQEADMAGAMVVAARPGKRMDFAWTVDGRLHAAIRLQWEAPTGAARRQWWQPAIEKLVIRFDPELQQQVMGEIAEQTRAVCDQALTRAGVRIEEIDLFVSHQPMAWYGAFMADVLGLRDGVVFDTFEEYGCINSAGIATSIHEARRAGRLRDGSKVLVFSPAAGYTFGAAVVRW